MARTLVRVEQERKIIDMLTAGPQSITDVAEATGFNYYTVRSIINDLMKEGAVTLKGTHNNHRVFQYDPKSKRAEDIIPRITDLINKVTLKAISIIAAVGEEDNFQSAKAAKALPRHMTELMIAAQFAEHGMDIQFRLDHIRSEMQRDYLALKSQAHLYEQILQDPQFWDKRYLRQMPKDPDFHYPSIQKAKDYYDSVARNTETGVPEALSSMD